VKPNEFVDCVAVGSDAHWAANSRLIASNAVLTAGHCDEFATRVFFGHDWCYTFCWVCPIPPPDFEERNRVCNAALGAGIKAGFALGTTTNSTLSWKTAIITPNGSRDEPVTSWLTDGTLTGRCPNGRLMKALE
jgi:hypothetical protein